MEQGIAEMAQSKDRMDLILSRIDDVDKLVGQSSEASQRQTLSMTTTTEMLKDVVDAVNQTLGSVSRRRLY